MKNDDDAAGTPDGSAEWLEADGLGGFASGTVNGIRTRRYHALLLAATAPPTGRVVLVNGFDAWVETSGGVRYLTSQAYGGDVIHPDGAQRIASFAPDPWPSWTFRLEDGALIEQEIFVPNGSALAAVRWRMAGRRKTGTLLMRPFLSGRDYHALHHENPAFRFEPEREGCRTVWRPYGGLPAVVALSNGEYVHAPDWYRNFRYEEERSRGLDFTEDLASPGLFRWDLSRGEAIFLVAAEGQDGGELAGGAGAAAVYERLRSVETRRRKRFSSRLEKSADAYLVRRGAGKTIVAGYPWFTDWGRDTFIAIRGLCLATGRLEDAREILVEWSGAVSEGMLPNLFTDAGAAPEFNSVDASLWYIIAVHEFLAAAPAAKLKITKKDQQALERALLAIVEGYAKGTRFGIRMDEDGLLSAGVPGVQLTWMDAKVGEWVVTPRVGKPVEVQGLWLNALRIASQLSDQWELPFRRGWGSFLARFWNEAKGCLFDVVDVEHRRGTEDATMRPNQIFAVGGLPFPLLDGDRARQVVDAVENRLLTPLGLRSLAPAEPGYAPHYGGGPLERDGAYHQGTVWPWLIGPFVEAWVRVRGGGEAVKREARGRFLAPLLDHLDRAGLGHISEIADAELPHTPRGCPFQAWSLGEALRLDRVVLATEASDASRSTARRV